jgi:molybdate transport system substrate-binding protein
MPKRLIEVAMKKVILFVSIFVLLLCSACTPSAAPESSPITLNILAAASLTEAFQEIAPAFEAAHEGVTLQFNFAGSQQLAQQLANGAPADVFASANQKQMDVAVEAGRIATDAPANFAQNRLVVVLPADNPAGISSLADLTQPGLKIVLAAKEVPVGQYALDFLAKADAGASLGSGYSTLVLANVVSYEENVKAVLTKVSLGEADAGIVYTSDAASATDEILQIEIPDGLNVIAQYPIAVVENSAHSDMARAFVEWVQSAEGQKVLEKYGFLPVK